jgi:hypothetical protein
MSDTNLPQTFDGDALLYLIKKLIQLDRHWIPQEDGHSLYIRPVMSASKPCLKRLRILIDLVSRFAQLGHRIPSVSRLQIPPFFLSSAAPLGHTTRTVSNQWLCTVQRSTCALTLEVGLQV